MTKSEAKRVACMRASIWIESNMGADFFGQFDEKDKNRVEQAMIEIYEELARRGRCEK